MASEPAFREPPLAKVRYVSDAQRRGSGQSGDEILYGRV